ncbi:hypothetical protein D0809_06515 [Flavobacterium circumlabens]|uniref:Beta-xylanase n=1 Tax=Flavobacterium circumlabens TaxID=2133765 RepID=A0A4Y7UEG2_9FLAO|nr:endo-1,4-beta-xylanase [Flavobacterium circumlabens]TCN59554.1 GH35 family endo-1,4-beta-xylanase [Flavobacterium circumlabens]TEB44843.1 hypothetical protein D0809_06515 [Flavobacterium circumlabens]
MYKIFTLFLSWLCFINVAEALAQVPSGTFILLTDGIAALQPFGYLQQDGVVKMIDVTNQPFQQALEINTYNLESKKGDIGFNANINTTLDKGEVLLISFKAKNIESKRETGESFIEVRLDQLVNNKYVWPSHIERGVSIGNQWTDINIPFVIEKDAEAKDLKFVIKFDSYSEKFQIGDFKFINYGSNIKLSDLPRSVVRYNGDKPTDSWRKEADERIEKYRKGDVAVTVLDSKGKPVSGASVCIKLNRIAFNWGTATNSSIILDNTSKDAKIYRDTISRYFNQVVFENEVKAKNWESTDHSKTVQSLDWFKSHNVDARGHVMLWPSFQNSPQLRKFKNDTTALRKAILDGIDVETTVMKGRFTEWDVINEPTLHHDVFDLLGKSEMINWFKRARKDAPGVKLFLNDYTMFHGKGVNSSSEKFYKIAKYLVDNKAEIDAIGEQAHIGGTPPGIPEVIERLEYFATLGLPIQISEFDINSNDDEFKANYMRDFMKAVFSQPSTIGFVQWGFWEGMHWFPVAALWDKDWNIRPQGRVYTQLVDKTWNTSVSGETGKNGIFKTRGFNGNYDIIVKYKGKEITKTAVLNQNGLAINVSVQ